MDGVDVSPDRSTWQHLALAIRDFARSGVRGRAAGFAGSLFVLLLGVNGLNVVNSYVGRDFMTAIEALHLSADYKWGNTDWYQFLQDANGHLDPGAILGHIEVVPVPEPGSIALVGIGLFGLRHRTRRCG